MYKVISTGLFTLYAEKWQHRSWALSIATDSTLFWAYVISWLESLPTAIGTIRIMFTSTIYSGNVEGTVNKNLKERFKVQI